MDRPGGVISIRPLELLSMVIDIRRVYFWQKGVQSGLPHSVRARLDALEATRSDDGGCRAPPGKKLRSVHSGIRTSSELKTPKSEARRDTPALTTSNT